MRQKFVFMTAVAVCLSLALVPAYASERTVDRHGDRTKAGKGESPTGVTPYSSDEQEILTLTIGGSVRNNSASAKAVNIISAAAKLDREDAILMLQRVMVMDLESTQQNDRILSSAYEMMAGLYSNAPSKQVKILGMALQYASGSARRADLESQIIALGGDVFGAAFSSAGMGNAYMSRDPGADDSCLGATAVALPHAETMSINPPGDHNWRSFDVLGGASDGSFARIQTISDFPGTGTDDTDLELWDRCPSDGGTLIGEGQDVPNDFTSRIDTGCLPIGTYYVVVGGFFDEATPDNFDFEIEITGNCFVPLGDSFEPDNDRANAADIGLPTPLSGLGWGWGRAHKEIQARTMVNPDRPFPEDERGDFDHAVIKLTQTSLVRMGTAERFPTFFNGFDSGSPFAADTILHIFYENEPDYGGRCNQPNFDFTPLCATDDDCPFPLDSPIPTLPPCIPWEAFGVPIFSENPLSTNDDRAGGDFGSELLMCLPRTASGTPSATLQAVGGGFMVRVVPWHPSGSTNYISPFEYELNVKNEVGCLFEQEPNNSRPTATPYELSSVVTGVYDFAVSNPFSDNDYYEFNVEETTLLKFETLALDPVVSDTFIALYGGPASDGSFPYLGVFDDNGGNANLSQMILELPPASALLGNPDANYQVRVSAFNPSANWPYQLKVSPFSLVADTVEVEPNDTEATANAHEMGGTIFAATDPSCDYDTFTFTLEEAAFLTFDETTPQDNAIRITDCNGNTIIGGCDEDSGGEGFKFFLDGCLPAGTYCAQTRGWNTGTIGPYEVETSAVGGCAPTNPPTMNGVDGGHCNTWDGCADGD